MSYAVRDDGQGWRRVSGISDLLPGETYSETQPVATWSREPTVNMVRAMRDIALNRLIGIGFAATIAGDDATVSAVMTARQAMLDLTKDPTVLAAENEADLLAALTSRYAAIVAAAPVGIRTAFRDLRL